MMNELQDTLGSRHGERFGSRGGSAGHVAAAGIPGGRSRLGTHRRAFSHVFCEQQRHLLNVRRFAITSNAMLLNSFIVDSSADIACMLVANHFWSSILRLVEEETSQYDAESTDDWK